MTSSEFSEWIAFYNIHPFGDERDDMRIAQLCSLIFNITRSKKQTATKITDWMFNFEQPDKPDATQESNLMYAETLKQIFSRDKK